MPKRAGDVIYLESGDSSGIETEYEILTKDENGSLTFKRRKLYKVRFQRKLPEWLENPKKEDEKDQKTSKSSNSGMQANDMSSSNRDKK